jgi:hypothetical protein
MLCDRLRQSGIAVFAASDGMAESRDLGPYDIYVAEADLDRVRAVLQEAASISREELAAAAEQHPANASEDGAVRKKRDPLWLWSRRGDR